MERQQHSDDPQQLDLLRVCRIGRAQGLKGEVTVRLYTDEPDYRFAPGSVLYARDGSQEYVVERSRTFKDRWIIKFEGIDDRDASEALNGVELYGEADDPDLMLEEDAWYPRDLVGLEARMAEGNGLSVRPGLVIGKVVDVIDGAQSLLKIRLSDAYLASLVAAGQPSDVADGESSPAPAPTANDDGESDAPRIEKTALVPFVEQLVPDIDLGEGYLTLDPPGGLIPGLN